MLIGLEQRPIRRRLKHGALPVLFKLTDRGWEEGKGEREKEPGEEEGGREEDGMDDDSDDDGRFVIQMDVAEEVSVCVCVCVWGGTQYYQTFPLL